MRTKYSLVFCYKFGKAVFCRPIKLTAKPIAPSGKKQNYFVPKILSPASPNPGTI